MDSEGSDTDCTNKDHEEKSSSKWLKKTKVLNVIRMATSPAGYTAEDVNFGRFFKAATHTSKRLLKAVFLVMLYRSRVAEVEVWPASMVDFCHQVLLWSKRKVRDNFQKDETGILAEPFESADYDVSLLTKMIHKCFSDMNLPESFSRAVRDLKNVRNRVCHEHEILNTDQLKANLDDLTVVFDNLLQETSNFFIVDTSALQNQFRNEIDEILNSTVLLNSSDYFENVKKFRAELVGQFITNGRKEAMSRYAKLKALNPFTWLSDEQFPEMTVDKIFTPLHILENSRVVNLALLLKTEIIEEETSNPTGILPSVLVVTGMAGCGKTSLCRYLLHDWRTGHGAVETLRSVDLVIFIEMRAVTSNALVPFLCKNLLLETCGQFKEKDIICTLGQMNVLYVVDGMDEATTDGRRLLNDVLSVLGNSRIIITTRPEFSFIVTQMVEKYHLSHMTLSNHGFSAEGVFGFTSRVFNSIEPNEVHREQQKSEFLKFLRTSGKSLGDHMKLPLTLALIICLWKDDKGRIAKVTSATKLYAEIMQLCSTKLISRLQNTSFYHELELQTFMDEWLLALGCEAYDMLEEEEFTLSEQRRRALATRCSKYRIDSIQVFSAFLECEVTHTFSGLRYHFSFLHKSQMEYLAALYVTNKLTQKSNLRTDSVIDPLKNLRIFGKVITGTNMGFRAAHLKAESFEPIQDTNIGFGASRMRSASFKPIRARKWINTMVFVIGHLCLNNAPDTVIEEVTKNLLEAQGYIPDPAPLWHLVQESGHHPIVCRMVESCIIKKYVWRPETKDLCDGTNPTFQLLRHTSFTTESVMIRVVGNLQSIKVVGDDGDVEERSYENLLPTLVTLAQRPATYVVLRCDQHFYDWDNPDTTDQLLMTLLPKGNLSALMGHVGVVGASALSAIRKVGEMQLRVSEQAALCSLAETLKITQGRIEKLVLRLDLPRTVLPSDLPYLTNAPNLSLHLRHVVDENASWAAEVIAALSIIYEEIDLLASSLTFSGAQEILTLLQQRRVAINTSLTVRSLNEVDESQYKSLSNMIQCSFQWWS